MTMHEVSHPIDVFESVYGLRKEGGSIKDSVDASIKELKAYIKMRRKTDYCDQKQCKQKECQ